MTISSIIIVGIIRLVERSLVSKKQRRKSYKRELQDRVIR